MSDELTPYITTIQRCETAIIRIRTAIRARNSDSPDVGEDFMAIQQAVTPRLAHYARRVRHLAPEAEDEALDAMFDQLREHIWSLTFLSLETGFGAYLNHMPQRVINKMQRKHSVSGVSSPVARLDAVNEDGLALHETVADPGGEAAFVDLEQHADLHAAIARLPDAERHAITMRLHDYENNMIAQHLGISPSSASRIYTSALTLLRQRLLGNEE